MLIVTAVFSGLLSLFFIKISFKVIQLRKLHNISLGSVANDELERAIRARANFLEYVPLSLLLMVSLELNDAPLVLVMMLGMFLFLGSYLHAKYMNQAEALFAERVKGMQFTFFALALLALSNIIWVAYGFVASVQFASIH
jgi:uncharacterized membrane protein YecN with MAPEG domain